ncbi:MAG: glycoside hydrolase family 65 protein, partial [Clostridia bacterium]|nr:glycoside hydrolase family 65 protein [Clostridia bacterium]
VLLMCLLPELFSDEEKTAAYEYYEPRTVHDSSLSYAPHAWLAARLGKTKEAYEYFKQCAYLDITDIKLNTVSGLHRANFGGTWASVIYGFCGVSFKDNVLSIDPHLPDKWRRVKFTLLCRGEQIDVEITKDGVKAASRTSPSKVSII